MLLGLVISSVATAAPPLSGDPGFGKQWVRENPFTIVGQIPGFHLGTGSPEEAFGDSLLIECRRHMPAYRIHQHKIPSPRRICPLVPQTIILSDPVVLNITVNHVMIGIPR